MANTYKKKGFVAAIERKCLKTLIVAGCFSSKHTHNTNFSSLSCMCSPHFFVVQHQSAQKRFFGRDPFSLFFFLSSSLEIKFRLTHLKITSGRCRHNSRGLSLSLSPSLQIFFLFVLSPCSSQGSSAEGP